MCMNSSRSRLVSQFQSAQGYIMTSLTLNLGFTALMVFVLYVDALTNSQKCITKVGPNTEMPSSIRWYYNNYEGVCKTLTLGGGNPVNDNNFNTKEKCLEFCNRDTVCAPFVQEQPQCWALHHRYKYISETNGCEMFYYGGCGGNANNFGSQEACETKCKVIITT